MKKFILVTLLLLNFVTYSQETYVVDGLHNQIFKLESNFSYSLVVTFSNQSANSHTGDIAIAPNGLMYGLARNGKIFTINLSDGTTQMISEFPPTNQLNSYVSLT
ncbi:MAG: hypothetical protein JST78_08410 [Bacteroidetes bacterium]|nr:hypothetical protein [Bacteroidota bacterium]